MDNFPNDGKKQNGPPRSGEIFNNQNGSSYNEAINSIPETKVDQPFANEVNQSRENYSAEQGYPQAEYNNSTNGTPYSPHPGDAMAPPPYEVDHGRRFLLIALFFLLIGLAGFFLFRYIKGKKSKPPVADKTITLNYWGLWEDDVIIQSVIDDYQRLHTNVTVKYSKQNTTDYRERLQAAIERGEGPDIFRFHNTWLPMLIRQLSPMQKDIFTDDDYTKTFYPVTTHDLKSGGYYYGIPLEVDGLLLFYNEDILKSANVAVPKTWEDVKNAVGKITVKEKEQIITAGIALGTADNIEHLSDILALMMLQNGTKIDSSLFTCQDKTKNDCAVEALTYYRQFAEGPNKTWDDTMDNSIIAFSGGKVAMIFAPSWQTYTIKELSKNSNLNFKTAPPPQLPCQTQNCTPVNWATYWVEGVSNKSLNQKAAWEFLKYLSKSDVMEKIYNEEVKVRKIFGEPYSRKDLADKLKDNPYISAVVESAPNMQSFYSASRTFDGKSGLNSSLNNYLSTAVSSLNKGVSPETALRTADSGFKEVYSRFGISSMGQ